MHALTEKISFLPFYFCCCSFRPTSVTYTLPEDVLECRCPPSRIQEMWPWMHFVLSLFTVLILNYMRSSRGGISFFVWLHSSGIYLALPFPPLFSSPPPAATFHRLNSIRQPSAELLPIPFTPQFCLAGNFRLTWRMVSLADSPQQPPQTQLFFPPLFN